MEVAEAFALIDRQAGRVASLLADIVAVDTTVPPGCNYRRMCEVLAAHFSDLGMETEFVVEPPDYWAAIPLPLEGERVNLVARKKTGKPPVSVYAHYDTVPVGEGWTVEPFGGEVKDGLVYGRGTADMKGSIASLLLALEAMQESHLEPLYDIHCLMCCDEEIGLAPGVRYLAEQGHVRGDLLWLEGGGQFPMTLKAMAGIAEVDVTTVGKSGHSGAGFVGVNAVEAMVPILDELLLLKEKEEAFQSAYRAFPIPGAASTQMTPKFNLNMISGGLKFNIIPDSCTVVIDRRYMPDEDYDTVAGNIREAVARGAARSKALDVRVNVRHVYKPLVIDEKSPGNRKAARALQLIHGWEPENWLVAGVAASTDMGDVQAVVPEADIIGMGPLGLASVAKAHAEDECVAVADLLGLAKQLLYYFCFED